MAHSADKSLSKHYEDFTAIRRIAIDRQIIQPIPAVKM